MPPEVVSWIHVVPWGLFPPHVWFLLVSDICCKNLCPLQHPSTYSLRIMSRRCPKFAPSSTKLTSAAHLKHSEACNYINLHQHHHDHNQIISLSFRTQHIALRFLQPSSWCSSSWCFPAWRWIKHRLQLSVAASCPPFFASSFTALKRAVSRAALQHAQTVGWAAGAMEMFFPSVYLLLFQSLFCMQYVTVHTVVPSDWTHLNLIDTTKKWFHAALYTESRRPFEVFEVPFLWALLGVVSATAGPKGPPTLKHRKSPRGAQCQ
jgi:hypothetical protein